jgi:hypothetical protein
MFELGNNEYDFNGDGKKERLYMKPNGIILIYGESKEGWKHFGTLRIEKDGNLDCVGVSVVEGGNGIGLVVKYSNNTYVCCPNRS